MYLTEEKFDKAMTLIDEKFGSIDDRFDYMDKKFEGHYQSLKKEIAGVFTFIRDFGEEMRLKSNEDTQRYMGSLLEEYQSRLQLAGELNSLTDDKCDRRCLELEENDERLSKRISKLETKVPLI